MAKRFTDTNKWSEDWFLDLPINYKLFWIYICDNCDHAGIYKINKRLFEFTTGTDIVVDEFLTLINKDKERVRVLDNGRWYLASFIKFQYGAKLTNSKVHQSILKILQDNSVQDVLECSESKVKKEVKNRPKNIQESIQYFIEKGSSKALGEKFFYYYESQGWKVGKNPMKNWKMAASGWISRETKNSPSNSGYLNDQLKEMGL